MRLQRAPETTSFGIVLPPSPEEVRYLSLFKGVIPGPDPERHHFYWPKRLYTSDLVAKRFRGHPLNIGWIPEDDHDRYHNRYDGVPMLSAKVMLEFLNEAAKPIEGLGISLDTIGGIVRARYDGQTRTPEVAAFNEQKRLETINAVDEIAGNFRLIPEELVRLAINQLVLTPEAMVA